ncbi:MAG: hypothetical protein MZV65_13140 [Chromatiales bacterium]|nr:hypothetical protein [Chromatiales bacterium]
MLPRLPGGGARPSSPAASATTTATAPTPPPTARELVPAFLRQTAVYDNPAVQKSFVQNVEGNVREASLILEGMVCAACVWLNEQPPRQAARRAVGRRSTTPPAARGCAGTSAASSCRRILQAVCRHRLPRPSLTTRAAPRTSTSASATPRSQRLAVAGLRHDAGDDVRGGAVR